MIGACAQPMALAMHVQCCADLQVMDPDPPVRTLVPGNVASQLLVVSQGCVVSAAGQQPAYAQRTQHQIRLCWSDWRLRAAFSSKRCVCVRGGSGSQLATTYCGLVTSTGLCVQHVLTAMLNRAVHLLPLQGN